MESCPEYATIKGGEFPCHREKDHKGVHMAESGDNADYGFYKKDTWEIVEDVKKALEVAKRRVG